MTKVSLKIKKVKTSKKKAVKKVPLAIKSYINRTIKRSEETKHASVQYTWSRFNSQILSPADVITLMPQIIQTTTQDGRIGNTIKPIRMEINGYIVYDTPQQANNQDARMIGARLFVYQDKSNRAVENAIFNYNILNLGGTSTTFTGTALNYITPHNNDQFIFYADRKYKLLKPYGYTNNTSPGSTTAITGMDSSLFHPFKIVLGPKQLPAVLKYDQTDNITYPTNFNPKLALGYCDLLAAAPDVTSTQIAMTFVTTLYYKDG